MGAATAYRSAAGMCAMVIALSALAGCEDDNEPLADSCIAPTRGADEGLVAYWAFDEGEGRSIADRSGYGSTLRVAGAQWVEGISGGGLDFDGQDDYVELAGGGTPPQLADLGQGSISLWFKSGPIPTLDGILPIFYYGSRSPCVNMFDAANQGILIELGHSPVHPASESLYFTIFANGCSLPSFCYDTRDPVLEDEWHHFVAVVGEDCNTGYLDGQEVTGRRYNFGDENTSEFFADAVSREIMWIGRGYWDAEPVYFEGVIDEVRAYDRPLSATDVRLLYQAGPPEADRRQVMAP